MYTSSAFVPHSHLPAPPPFPAGSLSLTWARAAYRKLPAWALATPGSNSAEGSARVHHDKGTWISWDLSLPQASTSWTIREYGSTANLLLGRLQDEPNGSPSERTTGYVSWLVLWEPLHPAVQGQCCDLCPAWWTVHNPVVCPATGALCFPLGKHARQTAECDMYFSHTALVTTIYRPSFLSQV